MMPITIDTKTYGEKFFVVYVSSTSCTNCESIQPGFATLQDGWGSSFVNTDGRAFKMYTVYSDETSSNDDQDVNKLHRVPTLSQQLPRVL
jgi:hypothetical protein